MYADPNRDQDAFWQLVIKYVRGVVFRRVKPYQVDDVVGYVLLQVVAGLPALESHEHTDPHVFSKWLYRMSLRKLITYLRLDKSAKEIPISQFAKALPSGDFEEVGFEDLNPEAVSQFDDPLDESKEDEKDAREAEVGSILDEFSATLTDLDRQVLELFRQGLNRYQVAKALAITPSRAHSRLLSWRRKRVTAQRKAEKGTKWRSRE
jgi:RNA polymerase sigma factor (sigma-70 family)